MRRPWTSTRVSRVFYVVYIIVQVFPSLPVFPVFPVSLQSTRSYPDCNLFPCKTQNRICAF
jgi:hypothetical protein